MSKIKMEKTKFETVNRNKSTYLLTYTIISSSVYSIHCTSSPPSLTPLSKIITFLELLSVQLP